MIVLLLLAFIVIVLIEVPSLIKKKHWRELTVFSILLVTAFIMALLQIIGVTMPNPFHGTTYLIRDILHLNYN
ncbi:hypothetical protein [Desulfosporosinus fructosivorans]|nr:hypothetical protein [Desulfosporosinus fructosivorans]